MHSPTISVRSARSQAPLFHSVSKHQSAWSPSTAFAGSETQKPHSSDADKRHLDVFKIVKNRTSPLLALFNDEELRTISETCLVRYLDAGELLMTQGESSSSMFIVLQGVVDIFVDNTGVCSFENAVKVDTIEGVVGEVGMLTGQRREAFAQAGCECIVLELTLSEVRAISLKRIDLRAQLVSLMAEVRRQKNCKTIEKKRNSILGCEDPHRSRAGDIGVASRSPRSPRRQDLANVVSVAKIIRKTAQILEQQEEKTLAQILISAESWIDENRTVVEEYECRPLVYIVTQHPLVTQMYVPSKGISLLHKAASIGNVFVCSQLIHCKCPVNLLDFEHRSALHHAVEGSNHGRGACFETLRLLLECGAIQVRDMSGDAPADVATRDDVRLLLSQHLKDQQLSVCALAGCSKKPMTLCKACKLVKYCCLNHLKSDWAEHSEICAASRPEADGAASPQAWHALNCAHRKINNLSLEKGWQIRKRFGISIEQYASLHHQKVYLSVWVRYLWIIKASLSLAFLDRLGDIRLLSSEPFDLPFNARTRKFQLEISQLMTADKEILKKLSITELQSLCLEDIVAIRKPSPSMSSNMVSLPSLLPSKAAKLRRKSSILLQTALQFAGQDLGFVSSP